MEVPLQDLSTFRPAGAGRCIYCGDTTKLTDEHILPYGLGGPAEIPLASCRRCARITGAIEQDVLRGALWPIRVYRDLSSRSKHRHAPRTVDIAMVFEDGREELVPVPIDQAPIIFMFPIFAPPGIVEPRGYTAGVRLRGVAGVAFSDKHQDIAARYGAKSFKISQTTDPPTFARMIAKIGYAMASADGNLSRLETAYPVVSSILGKTDDVGRWVGSYTDLPPRHPTVLHHLVAREFRERGIFVYEIQLFADSQAPCYTVVLGTLPGSERDRFEERPVVEQVGE
jgi:tellurite resistance protein